MCRRCNDGCNDCKCTCTKRCINERCDCPIYLSSDCTTSFTEDLPCSGILKGQTLNETILALDAFICEKFGSVNAFFALISVGDGAEIYKGTNNIGQKEIKSLLAGDLITITEQTDTVTIAVNEEALQDLIDADFQTYTATSFGTGAEVLKGTTIVDDNTDFEFRSIITTNSGEGADVLKPQTENTNDITITAKSILGSNLIDVTEQTDTITLSVDEPTLINFVQENQFTYSANSLGDGEEVYAGNTVAGDNTQFNFKSIKSDTLVVSATTTEISIELPEVTDIPRFIVNSAYTGTEETGTLSKPFKTIQGALTAFVGTGNAQNPEFAGAEVVIQKGIGYTFTGTLAYNDLTLVLEEGAGFLSNPASGDWLCDYDTLSATDMARLTIIMKDDSIITLSKSGFKNGGTSVNNGLLADTKTIVVKGTGTIYQETINILTYPYTILESNYVTTDTLKNDSGSAFEINGVKLLSLTQPIYKVGGNSFLEFVGTEIQSGLSTIPINSGLQAFDQIGGLVRRSGCTISFSNSSPRTTVFSFTKNAAIGCFLITIDESLLGNCTTLFQNNGSLQSSVDVKALKTFFFTCTNIAKSPSVLWTGFGLFNSVIDDGDVDYTQVDMTAGNSQSTYNILNRNVVENLREYGTRALAVSAGLVSGSKFLNTNSANVDTDTWFIDIVI